MFMSSPPSLLFSFYRHCGNTKCMRGWVLYSVSKKSKHLSLSQQRSWIRPSSSVTSTSLAGTHTQMVVDTAKVFCCSLCVIHQQPRLPVSCILSPSESQLKPFFPFFFLIISFVLSTPGVCWWMCPVWWCASLISPGFNKKQSNIQET